MPDKLASLWNAWGACRSVHSLGGAAGHVSPGPRGIREEKAIHGFPSPEEDPPPGAACVNPRARPPGLPGRRCPPASGDSDPRLVDVVAGAGAVESFFSGVWVVSDSIATSAARAAATASIRSRNIVQRRSGCDGERTPLTANRMSIPRRCAMMPFFCFLVMSSHLVGMPGAVACRNT